LRASFSILCYSRGNDRRRCRNGKERGAVCRSICLLLVLQTSCSLTSFSTRSTSVALTANDRQCQSKDHDGLDPGSRSHGYKSERVAYERRRGCREETVEIIRGILYLIHVNSGLVRFQAGCCGDSSRERTSCEMNICTQESHPILLSLEMDSKDIA